MPTYTEANNDIQDTFYKAWLPRAVVYENVGGEKPLDEKEPYARPTVRHFTGGQDSLIGGLVGDTNEPNRPNVRRYRRTGLFTAQVFSILAAGLGSSSNKGNREYIYSLSAVENLPVSMPDTIWDYKEPVSPWTTEIPKITDAERFLFRAHRAVPKDVSIGDMVVDIWTAPVSFSEPAYILAQCVSDAFEGIRTRNDIWFRNVRIREIGSSRKVWFQTNVLADFEYTEVK